MGRLRTWLVAGLLVWVPLGVTFLVVKPLVDLADQVLLLLPAQYRPEHILGFNLPGVGVALTLLTVIITGMVFANLFGRRLVRLWEDILARIPLVRSIYSSVKQITETLFSAQGKSFRKVVMVEYPRRELWTLAFVTGDTAPALIEITGEDLISIYVPTTPNPTSGYLEVDEPMASLLLTKPLEEELGGVEHGGGAKMHLETDPSYLDFVEFLERYAQCKSAGQ